MADKPGAAVVETAVAGTTGTETKTTTTISNPPNDTKAGGAATTVGTPNGETQDGAGDEATLVEKAGTGTTEEAAKPAGEKGADEKPKGAPEKYEDFKLPDGFQAEPEALKGFQQTAKELNLSQEQAQKLIEFQAQHVAKLQEQQAATWTDLREGWKKESLKVLGPKSDESLALVARSRDRFSSPELNKLLNESGLGDHPAVIKHFIELGKQISEDTVVDGKPASGNTNKTIAEILYPNLKP